MRFNVHRNLEGLHAPFSPSQSSWLRYDDEKAMEVYANKKAAEMGTRLHAWAKDTIDVGIKYNSVKIKYQGFEFETTNHQVETCKR